MPLIPLNRRDGSIAAYAVIDDTDLDDIAQHHWYLGTRGYAMRQAYLGSRDGVESREAEFIHRRLMGLAKGDGLQVDHINRDKLDNRRSNLRVVTHKQNNENRTDVRSMSGIRGVHWQAGRNTWFVRVIHNGRQYLGGRFTDLVAAEAAAIALRRKLHTHAPD